MSAHSPQLGFDALLDAADADNRDRRIARESAHLPGTLADALPFYRQLIGEHHAAMLGADVDEVMRLREDAGRLAVKLNGGNPGILAGPDAPGYVLERDSAAAPGAVPLWGQTGVFVLAVCGMEVRIELDGMFGIGAGYMYWPGFAAHAVDYDRPFLSPTGYRSFLGIHAEPVAGTLPDEFVRMVIQSYVRDELKGRLLRQE